MAPGGNGPNQGMSDPIGALQTLARQGTGNNQMMGIPNTGANPQGMVPQPNTNAATNRKLFVKLENLFSNYYLIDLSLQIISILIYLQINWFNF